MKVIHLISGGDSGGAKTHVHSLLRNLSKTLDVTLVCFMDGPFAREAAELGIPTLVIPGNNLPATLHKLRALIRKEGAQIIHCHGSRANLIGSLLIGSVSAPVLTTVHSDYRLDYMGRPLAAVTYGTLNALALRRIRYRIGVSDSMRDMLIARGFAPNSTFKINNGIDFERVPKRYSPEAFYKRIGADIRPGDVVVGTAARLDPVKDQATLIRGFARARESVPALKLIIAGEGPERERLLALARTLNVADAVFLAGWVEDPDELYEAIHINTLTSISETFPYAITEGAFHRLPTVSTRVGGVPSLVRNGQSGFLITPGDDEALGRALASLGGDAALRRTMGDAVYEKAEEFSMTATCRTQTEIYEEILRREALGKEGRDGVLICGAYGHGNSGDEAILEAIVAQMRSIDKYIPITVLSRTPRETSERNRVASIHSFAVFKIFSAMRKAKLYINGGGSLIQDVTSRRSLMYYLATLRWAKELGCAVLMYGCGIGPVNYPGDVRAAREVLNKYVDAITLREPDSIEELARFGVTKPCILLSSDPALSLPAAPTDEVDAALSAAGIDGSGKYICLALRRWPGFEERAGVFAACCEHAYKKYGLTPVFVSINHKSDGDAAAQVAKLLSCPYYSLPGPLSTALTIGVMAKMDTVVSMRLHGLIFAAGQGVPLVGVSYDPKVTAFLRLIENSGCAELESVTAEELCSLVDGAAAIRGDKEARRASVKKLARLEQVNVDKAAELLGKGVRA